jgi:phage-related protein
MIPILYDSKETSFASNGLCRLRDAISVTVVEERNGIYECDFSYPVDGENYDLVQLGRIIGVTHDESGDIQPFDIVSCSRPIGGVATFHCTHISYRQSKMVSYASGINTLNDAFRAFRVSFFPDNPIGEEGGGNPFTYLTDKDSSGYVAAFDGTPRTIRSILGGVEGSILDTFGGEYEWDKWNVILHTARGEAKNFSIRYGVNLIDFQDDTDYGESFNTCVPFWTDSSSGVTVIGGEINTEQSTIGVGDKCVPLDLSDKFEEQPTTAQLETMAAQVMGANQPYLPSQNIKVDFMRLQDEAGFDQFDSLLQCKLCDSIKVVFPRYDMSAYFKIVKTTWNVLLDRYDEMELGNLSTTLAEALGISESASSSASEGGGLSPDYANYETVTTLPYSVSQDGIIMYAVGDGSGAGTRDLLINGSQFGLVKNPVGGISTITAMVSAGDTVGGTYGIWGTMRFIPFK